jgi:hypothetical protein
MSGDWLAIHAFCAREQDDLLLDAVLPLVRAMMSEGILSRWFFLRYSNGGPHLRLRLQCRVQREAVEQRVLKVMRSYFEASPPSPASTQRTRWLQECEERLDVRSVGAVELPEQLQPAGSVQVRPYVFDRLRYGDGEARERDTHNHFYVSSEISVAVLMRSRHSREWRWMFALFAALAVVKSGSASVEDWSGLFGSTAQWGAELHQGGFVPLRAQPDIVRQVRPFLLSDEPEWPEPWTVLMQLWREEIRRRSKEFTIGATSYGTRLRFDYDLFDGLHLLCNRLGLGLTEECYIYHLLSELLAERDQQLPVATLREGPLSER